MIEDEAQKRVEVATEATKLQNEIEETKRKFVIEATMI